LTIRKYVLNSFHNLIALLEKRRKKMNHIQMSSKSTNPNEGKITIGGKNACTK